MQFQHKLMFALCFSFGFRCSTGGILSDVGSLINGGTFEALLKVTSLLNLCKPTSAQLANVTMRLYTSSNPDTPQVIKKGDTSTIGPFSKSAPTMVIIHGWTFSAENLEAVSNFRQVAVSSLPNWNVMFVNWKDIASDIDYPCAALKATYVAEYLGTFITWLNSATGASLSQYHVVGHSMGAQVAGDLGQSLGGKLPRITGLDAAGPLYRTDFNEVRLDPTDAVLVDVIHSSGGTLLVQCKEGLFRPLGHVDFYPNGGRTQGRCQPQALFPVVPEFILCADSCSHYYAVTYFVESIQSPSSFLSYQCANIDDYNAGKCFSCSESSNCTNNMGFGAKETPTGRFYLATRDYSPYSGDQVYVTANTSTTFTGNVTFYFDKDNATLIYDDTKTSAGTVSKVIATQSSIGPQLKVLYTGDVNSIQLQSLSLLNVSTQITHTAVTNQGIQLTTGQNTTVPLQSS